MESAIDGSVFAVARTIEPELLQAISKRAKRNTHKFGSAFLHTISNLQRLFE